MVLAAGFAPAPFCALDAVPLLLGYASKMAPVVGLAPTRIGLKDRALGSLHSRAKKEESSRSDSHRDCAFI
jgi:hypothetical protein